jgi:hypothetical protein
MEGPLTAVPAFVYRDTAEMERQLSRRPRPRIPAFVSRDTAEMERQLRPRPSGPDGGAPMTGG